jgi:hypothetical protein
MKVKKITKLYEKTVYEEPFAARKFGVVLEAEVSDTDDVTVVAEALGSMVVSLTNADIREYASDAKTYHELEDFKKGITKGKHVDVL